jgi:PleD family two-component response regulator
MDLVMPQKNGFEAAQQIRQNPAMNDVLIIALSASVFYEHRHRSMAAGCDLFIPKPIDTGELLKQMQNHLGLAWIYREGDLAGHDPDQEAAEQPLIPPPDEEIRILFDLAMKGDMVGLENRAAQIEQMGKKYRPFVRKLRQLVKDFEDEQILAMIQAYVEEN